MGFKIDWELLENGFQIKKPKPRKKTGPPWVFNKQSFRKKLQEEIDWRYLVGYLYWQVGWSAKDIAKEFEKNLSAVKSTLYRIKKM